MKGTYTLNPDMVFKRLGDRMVLVHVATNQIYEFNDTAARVWELLENGLTIEAVIEQLTAEFEVDPSTLRNEIKALIGDLVTKGLIAT